MIIDVSENMKCLSIKQPFAELIVSGKKTIELRTWNTKFRGEFLIHASQKLDKEICQLYNIDPNSLVKGAVIGKALLYDVKEYKSNKEFLEDQKKHLAPESYVFHNYGFLIKNAVRFQKPIYMPGRLNFFDLKVNP